MMWCSVAFCAIHTPSSLTVKRGKDTVFRWNTTNGIASVRWGLKKPASSDSFATKFIYMDISTPPIVDADVASTDYKGRVSFVGNLTAGHAWFKITKLIVSDTNTYGANIREMGQNSALIFTSVNLTVTVPPEFTLDEPPSSKTIKEGDNLSIQCSAKGPPTPQVTWLHSGNILSQGEGIATLNIVNIKRNQSGIYECQASNNRREQPAKTTTQVTVYYPPVITTSPNNTTVTQGDDIILKCQASGNPPANIKWSRDNDVPIKPGHKASDGTLTIPNAVKSDTGKYICTAKNVYDHGQVHTATAAAYVTVRYPPSIVHHSNNQTVNETDSLSLTCTADGYPIPTITWTKSPGTITSPNTGKVFTILSVKRSDARTYTCTASNGIASDAMTSIQVTVQYKPSIDQASSTNNISSWKENTITLKCVAASGLPQPTFTWYKPNGGVIPCNQCSRTVSSQVTVQTGQESDDYGLYKCIATNVVGSDQHYINVTQLFPPGRPNITVTNIEASSVIVRWTKPVYDSGSPVIQYKLIIDSKTYDIDAPNTHKSISGLTKNTTYEVKLSAKNIAGYGSASSKVFTTKKQGSPSLPEVKIIIHQTIVTLIWSKPDENGGKITIYTIYKKVVGMDVSWSKVAEVTATNYTVEYLDPGKKYSFIVTATNQHGESLKDNSKAKTVVIPVETTTTTTTTEPAKDKSSGGDSGSNTTIIIACSIVAVVLILITAVMAVIILRKKNIIGQGKSKKSRNANAAYHNDVDSSDASGRHAAVIDLGQDGIPTYAAVDLTKKTKKQDKEIPDYAMVDKTKKKKRPGEIIYAELADFNTTNTTPPAAPAAYASTDYADITQFQNMSEQEPTYANFPGRSKAYTDVSSA